MVSLCVTGNFLNDPLPAAKAVALNQDLITLILVRLPVKSLLRFNCVSKQWLCLISSQNFYSRHRSLSFACILLSRIPRLISHLSLNCSSSEQPFSSLDFMDDSVGVKLLQSINGLVLGCSFYKLGKTISYYICNPSRRQFLPLRPPNAKGHDSKGRDSFATILGVYLAFDPIKLSHYQVVCVQNCSSSEANDHYQIQIYASEARTWMVSRCPFMAPSDMMFENGVLWNGAIHWISPTGATLCFDINQERFGSMPGPPSGEHWGTRRFKYFGESGGHLHLVEVYGPSITQFQVFELVRDYSRWIPKYQIEISPIIDAFPEMVRNYLHPHPYDSPFYAFVLHFVLETEEGSSLLLQIPGKFISDNIRDKSFKEICDFDPKSTKNNAALHVGCFHAHQFIETLASV